MSVGTRDEPRRRMVSDKPCPARARHLPAPVLQMSVGREVRRWRRHRNLKGADLAKAAGISFGMLSRIEGGTVTPSLATLQALSVALGVPISAFFRSYGREKCAVYTQSAGSPDGRTKHVPVLADAPGKNGTVVKVDLRRLSGDAATHELRRPGHISFLFILQGELLCRYRNKTRQMRQGDAILTHNTAAIALHAVAEASGLVMCFDVGPAGQVPFGDDATGS
jgi:DNA-binding XRE family transcriptional regulator